jgi:hypothetical protein
MLSLGFLTKGFVTFTPLSFPFFLWLFLRKNKFPSMVLDSFIILSSAILPLILLYLFTGAGVFLPQYIEFAFSKISTGVTTASRFYIIYRLVMELLPAIGIFLAFLLYCRIKKIPFNKIGSNLRIASAFFSLGLAGILPILTTMDQSTYFLFLSLPFFAISLGLLVNPLIEPLLERMDYNSNGDRLFKIFGVTALSAGIILSIYFSGDFNRDENILRDMRVILPHLEEYSTISILPEMREDWSLYSYYGRYKNVSLDPDLNNMHEFFLVKTSLYSDTINNRFEKIDLNTSEYDLFRRKNTATTDN